MTMLTPLQHFIVNAIRDNGSVSVAQLHTLDERSLLRDLHELVEAGIVQYQERDAWYVAGPKFSKEG